MTCKKGLLSHKENYEFNYLNITFIYSKIEVDIKG